MLYALLVREVMCTAIEAGKRDWEFRVDRVAGGNRHEEKQSWAGPFLVSRPPSENEVYG